MCKTLFTCSGMLSLLWRTRRSVSLLIYTALGVADIEDEYWEVFT